MVNLERIWFRDLDGRSIVVMSVMEDGERKILAFFEGKPFELPSEEVAAYEQAAEELDV